MWDQRLLEGYELARYRAAAEVLRAQNSSSHNLIDNAETFLVNLAKQPRGYPQPCITLATYYFNKSESFAHGHDTRKAYQKNSFDYYRKYFHRTDPSADRPRDVMANYRYQYGHVAFNTGRHDLGVANYRLAVKFGSLVAAYELAYILHGLRGWKGPRDISAAVNLYMRCITAFSTEASIDNFRHSARENLKNVIDNILVSYGVGRVVSVLQEETRVYKGSLRKQFSAEDFALLYRISRSAFNHLRAYAPMLHMINEVVLFLDQSDRALLVKKVAADKLNVLPAFGDDYQAAAEFHAVILEVDISKADWYFDFLGRVPDKVIVRSGLELWRSKIIFPSDFSTFREDQLQLKTWLRGCLLSAEVFEDARESLFQEAEKFIRLVHTKPEMKTDAEKFARLCGRPEFFQPSSPSLSRLHSPSPSTVVPVTPPQASTAPAPSSLANA